MCRTSLLGICSRQIMILSSYNFTTGNYSGPPLMWPPFLPGWSIRSEGVVSHQGDTSPTVWDLLPDFGSLTTGGTAWQRVPHDRGPTAQETTNSVPRQIQWAVQYLSHLEAYSAKCRPRPATAPPQYVPFWPHSNFLSSTDTDQCTC